jgi:hypothetical protein
MEYPYRLKILEAKSIPELENAMNDLRDAELQPGYDTCATWSVCSPIGFMTSDDPQASGIYERYFVVMERSP